MIKNLAAQKTETEEKIIKAIDEYYEAFEKGSNDPRFNINEIERLMLENQKKIKEVLKKASEELTSNVEIEDKKTVPIAKND